MSIVQTEAKKASDYNLVHRIKQYINEAEKPNEINTNSMIEDLRLKYSDYGREQISPFRDSALKAYKMILEGGDNEENDDLIQGAQVYDDGEGGDNEENVVEEDNIVTHVTEINDDGEGGDNEENVVEEDNIVTHVTEINDDGEGGDNEENDVEKDIDGNANKEDDNDNGNADENDDEDNKENNRDNKNEAETIVIDLLNDSMEITDTDTCHESLRREPLVQNMTNSSRQETVADVINICSDEEEPPLTNKRKMPMGRPIERPMGRPIERPMGRPIVTKDSRRYINEAEKPNEINTDSMIEDLRLKYSEYGREQISPFRDSALKGCEHSSHQIKEEPEAVIQEAAGVGECFCFYCEWPCESLQSLKKHIKRHHSSLYRGCERSSHQIKEEPEAVIQEAAGVGECFCFYCEWPCESLQSLKKHIKRHHSSLYRAYKMILEEGGDNEENDDLIQGAQVYDDGEGGDNEENDVEEDIDGNDNKEDDNDNGNADENDDEDNKENNRDMKNEAELIVIDLLNDSMEITDTDTCHESLRREPLVQNMTNSSRQETVADVINISSDEEEPPLTNKRKMPMGRPIERPMGRPIERPMGRPIERPMGRPIVTKDSRRMNFTNKYRMPNLPQVKMTAIGRGIKRRAEANDLAPISKRIKEDFNKSVPKVTFDMFGGFTKILKTVSSLVMHIKVSGAYQTLGVNPPRGILLHGPPGCGKTLLAQAIAGQLQVPLIRVAGPELVGGISGESESRVRGLFESAITAAPCIVFIDEIDAVCPPRDTARREMERRIVAQLLTCIDSLSESTLGEKVVIIGATNRADAQLDPALRRAGRFDRELCLGIPDRVARKEILEVITKNVKLKPNLDLEFIAAATPGFVGADLKSLLSEAAIAAVNRCSERLNIEKVNTSSMITDDPKKEEIVNGINHSNELESNSLENKETNDKPSKQSEKSDELNFNLSILNSRELQLSSKQLEDLFIEMEDIMKALKAVQPSAKREGFATVPDVTWENIGSLRDIRSELERSIMMPVKYPKEFSLLGITAPSGILLCGPPGCGKTLLAKAVANEANINFISVKGPELLNMYVGESERGVRQCFQRARNSQPCVIFFDEIDALCPKRSAPFEGHNTSSRVVNQVLTEMDGLEGRKGVFLMAATNRPDMVDPAVLRPGRLDKILYVGLPSPSDRADILKALTKNGTTPPMQNVDLNTIGSDPLLDGYTGADLAALVKEASVLALTEYIQHKDDNNLFVTSEMINQAAQKIRPSVSPKEREHYERLRDLYEPQKK